MSSWTEPVDLRTTDPRPTAIVRDESDAVRAAVRSRLGADGDDVLAALGIEVAA